MKKTFRLLATALMAGAMFAACGSDDNNDGGNKGGNEGGNGGGGENYPEITIKQATEGEVKAGFADAISIEGEGFDRDLDQIFVGWEENGVTQFREVDLKVLTLTTKRVSFGVNVGDDIVNKTIRVYLDRVPYDKMPLTKEITFKMPEVSEGYIPDPAFRATLMSVSYDEGNPTIAKLFDSYGLIAPAAAAKVKKCGAPNVGEDQQYGLNLYACKAKSLEGIELFKSIEGNVACWGMNEIEVMDFSKWEAEGNGWVTICADGLTNLKKVIGGPNVYFYILHNCPKLTDVDLHQAVRAYNVQLEKNTTQVTYFDIRKDRSGTEMGGPKEGADDWKGYPHEPGTWAPYLAGAKLNVADNCHILVDYQYLLDKYTDDTNGYACIYDAWKRGATIDVYSSKNIEKKLGTVPMYSADPTALTAKGANNWVPAEVE